MLEQNNLSYITGFLIGLSGNLHCFGMCSGIVAILSISLSEENKKKSNLYQIYYNVGRCIGYCFITAIAFILGVLLTNFISFDKNKIILIKLISNLMLILISFYLINLFNFFKYLEKIGLNLWNFLSKYIKHILPVDNAFKAIFLGFIWAYIPCGLFYSILILSLSYTNLLKCIIFVFFFWIGTLPSMISFGIFSLKIKTIVKNLFLKWVVAIFLFSVSFINLFFYIKNCH